MSEYRFSNVPEGEKRNATIILMVKDGAAWCVASPMPAERIAQLEKLLAELSEEASNETQQARS